MSERLKGMNRVLKVQDAVKRLADWQLAEAEIARGEAVAAREALAAFIDGEAPTAALAAAAVAQTRRLGLRESAAARRVEDAAQVVRDATGRQKLVERAVERLAREERAARERQDLQRLIEQALAARQDDAEGLP